MIEALGRLAHQPTWLTVAAERTVSRAMGGSCSMPLAAFITQREGDTLQLSAAWGDPVTADASVLGGPSAPPAPLVRVRQSAVVRSFADAEALGESVAKELRAGGAVWAGKTLDVPEVSEIPELPKAPKA